MLLTNSLKEIPFDLLIDLGCGRGDLISKLVKLKPNATFIGLDINITPLAKANDEEKLRKSPSTINFVCADCLNIPTKNECAEVVVLRGLLHHLDNIRSAINEIHRVLDNDGFLLLQDGTRMDSLAFKEMNKQLIKRGLNPEVHPGFDIKELKKQISDQNFLVEKVLKEGKATFATPPYTDEVYSTDLFLIVARKINAV